MRKTHGEKNGKNAVWWCSCVFVGAHSPSVPYLLTSSRLIAQRAHLRQAAQKNGIGIRDKDLIRLVSRAEIDLAAVQVEYERLFKKSLLQVIREEYKGAYREALLGIVKDIDSIPNISIGSRSSAINSGSMNDYNVFLRDDQE
ncbi:Annexin [Dictyocaulus viviparus]|uniref:Annexin n=1 Tax=Dictyocaulus viviparus TaxID=29172 RepID=A0A0D8X771_DICVI|nr:Annexin [Dictyocaulus viviparus]